MIEHIKSWADIAATGITVGAVLGWLPPVAAVLSIVWLSLQIYDRLTKGHK